MGRGPKNPVPIYDWAQKGGQSELLWNTIDETIETCVMPFEHEWEKEKLVKKIRDYFWKAQKNLTIKRNLQGAVDEFADVALGSLFAGLGDREWLYSGQADFTAVLDAGCQCCLNIDLMNTVEREEYGQIVTASYARAFEEQRFGPILTNEVTKAVQGPKTKKKLWNSMEAGRKQAMEEEITQLEDFVACWINASCGHLANETGHNPDSVLEAGDMAAFFHALFKAGALPIAMTQESGIPPEDWPLVSETVQMCYAGIADGTFRPPKKQRLW